MVHLNNGASRYNSTADAILIHRSQGVPNGDLAAGGERGETAPEHMSPHEHGFAIVHVDMWVNLHRLRLLEVDRSLCACGRTVPVAARGADDSALEMSAGVLVMAVQQPLAPVCRFGTSSARVSSNPGARPRIKIAGKHDRRAFVLFMCAGKTRLRCK